jgi:hypothetical protein
VEVLHADVSSVRLETMIQLDRMCRISNAPDDSFDALMIITLPKVALVKTPKN